MSMLKELCEDYSKAKVTSNFLSTINCC